MVAVGGSPEMVRHGGTEHSSDSALSFFSLNFASARPIWDASLSQLSNPLVQALTARSDLSKSNQIS